MLFAPGSNDPMARQGAAKGTDHLLGSASVSLYVEDRPVPEEKAPSKPHPSSAAGTKAAGLILSTL